MSETGYLIWFIAQTVLIVGLLVVLAMHSMGWFRRKPHPPHQFPNEPTHHRGHPA